MIPRPLDVHVLLYLLHETGVWGKGVLFYLLCFLSVCFFYLPLWYKGCCGEHAVYCTVANDVHSRGWCRLRCRRWCRRSHMTWIKDSINTRASLVYHASVDVFQGNVLYMYSSCAGLEGCTSVGGLSISKVKWGNRKYYHRLLSHWLLRTAKLNCSVYISSLTVEDLIYNQSHGIAAGKQKHTFF